QPESRTRRTSPVEALMKALPWASKARPKGNEAGLLAEAGNAEGAVPSSELKPASERAPDDGATMRVTRLAAKRPRWAGSVCCAALKDSTLAIQWSCVDGLRPWAVSSVPAPLKTEVTAPDSLMR